MRKHLPSPYFMVLICLAFAAGFASCTPSAPSFSEADATAIQALFDNTARDIRAGNFASWAAQFADSAQFLPPNAPAVTGRAAIQAWGQAMPPVESFGFADIQVTGEGNLAYGTSSYSLKLAGLPADTGKQLVVWGRQADGAWQVLRGAFNSNLPMPQVAGPAAQRR